MEQSEQISDEARDRAAAKTLKAVMRWRGVTTAVLAARMTDSGSEVSAGSIRNKLSPGSFGAGLFLRALCALECSPSELGHLIGLSAGHIMAEPQDIPANLGKFFEKINRPTHKG